VYISLPNSLHHEWTMRSLAAGKHVLCEKPYTRRPAEVDEAFDAADTAGLILQEAFMWRHTPQVRRLLELLDRIRPVRTIRSTFGYVIGSEFDVRLAADLDGGSLMDVGCYCVSGSRLVAGEPERVTGEQVIDPTGLDRRFTGMMRFPDDIIAEFTCGFDGFSESLEVIGQGGRILLPDPWHSRSGILYLDDEEFRAEPTNPYRLELEDVGAAIRGERPALLGRADALGQARTIEALYRSAATAMPVVLSR
jgi:xylose dehydrogenase (NAD/NADP)